MGESVAIVGTRSYPRLDLVRAYVKVLLPDTLVISGGARGPDTAAVKAAQEFCLETLVFRADWNRYGKRAGFVRNERIVYACTRLVAFWDMKSRGTKDSLRHCLRLKKPFIVFDFEGVQHSSEELMGLVGGGFVLRRKEKGR